MANYALVNSTTGLIENVVVWDGVTPWEPPSGLDPEEIPSGEEAARIGDYYIGGSFAPADIYYSTLAETLGQRVEVSPLDPQPADTTSLVPPNVIPQTIPPTPGLPPGSTMYWWGNNAPTSQWVVAWFNPNTYWDLAPAVSYLTKQVEAYASAALNTQIRDYSTVEILTASNVDDLFCADYPVTYGVYKNYINVEKATQLAILAAATDVSDLFTFNPTDWSTAYPVIASGFLFTGRGSGAGPEDLNVSYYTEFNSVSLTEADTELYVPGTDTVIPYIIDIVTGQGYFDSFGNCFNPGDYLIQIRQVSNSFVIAEFEVPLNPTGENVSF